MRYILIALFVYIVFASGCCMSGYEWVRVDTQRYDSLGEVIPRPIKYGDVVLPVEHGSFKTFLLHSAGGEAIVK
jgi:hypothetical protein